MAKIGVLIPTWNNNEFLIPCLNSLLAPVTNEDLLHIYIVNNGDARNMDAIGHPCITILQQKDNLGWEGGLKAGLEVSNEEFVVFCNDDILVPVPSLDWANTLLHHFSISEVGAVGPTSNFVMGAQGIFNNFPIATDVLQTNFLIGFFLMIRRSALDACGGVDDTLPGGDDLDLSIRLRKAGYKLLNDRNVFIYHHGARTGERVKGTSDTVGGWNSVQMMERTNFALIVKHGLRAYLECMNQLPFGLKSFYSVESNGVHAA
jgi:GT2 family glycosyltransferase